MTLQQTLKPLREVESWAVWGFHSRDLQWQQIWPAENDKDKAISVFRKWFFSQNGNLGAWAKFMLVKDTLVSVPQCELKMEVLEAEIPLTDPVEKLDIKEEIAVKSPDAINPKLQDFIKYMQRANQASVNLSYQRSQQLNVPKNGTTDSGQGQKV